MILKKCYLTNNSCFKSGKAKGGGIKQTGIVVHSTGAANTTLKRYVQPLDTDANYKAVIDDIGKNRYGNSWNHITREVGVHAFIGTNAKGDIEVYETMPYDYEAWGVGKGKKGSFNFAPNARIQFEICEDDKTDETYFNNVFEVAAEYCAYLCEKFGFSVSDICSHKESHDLGMGGNHGDPDHWLKVFGKDMNWFRDKVQSKLGKVETQKQEEKNCTCGCPCCSTENKLKVGDVVRLAPDAVVYGSQSRFASWVYNKDLYVRQINGERIVVSTLKSGAITGPVHVNQIIKKGEA